MWFVIRNRKDEIHTLAVSWSWIEEEEEPIQSALSDTENFEGFQRPSSP